MRQCVIFLSSPPPEFEPWSAWYAKYLDRDVFKFRGVELEGRDVRSRLFREWFKKEQVTYLGKANRFSRVRNPETVNSSFATFCKERGVELPAGYRQVTPNLEASFKSISKYDKVQPSLDVGAWELAGQWTFDHFKAAMSGSRVMSEEVVLTEMDKSTSCGFPWNLKFKDKNAFLADPLAAQALGDYWTLLSLPEEVMVPIWTCTQKCEMRTPEKIADNNLRTFTASPFEHSVNLNRMCLDMNNNFYNSANDVDGWTRTWSVVGASKFESGWDNLYYRLDRHPNAFELDESAFDSSLFVEALLGQMELRWSFLREEDRTPENRLRLERLYNAIVHSVIVLENGELIQKHTGNPSGSSNTIVDNTMILFRLFAYAWIVLCKQQSRATSYEEFMREVEAALCGDDNTFTVSDRVVGWFNPSTIAPVWSGIGVTTKTPCSLPRPLSEVQFLSQGFAFHDELGIWVPVPETERVLSSLMYGSDVDDVRWHFLRACALRMDSWGNPECRSVIAAYIEYLSREYKRELIGSVERPKGAITMETIATNWKSDAWMEALYCGRESGYLKSKERVSGVNHDVSFKIFYQQLTETLQSLSLKQPKMAKSAAAKARRAAKRKGKQLAYAGRQGPKRGPIFRNPQPVGKGMKKKKRSKGLAASMMSFGADSSGLNRSVGFTNRSVVEQVFKPRMEKVADLTGTAAFTMAQALYINPGNRDLFPIFAQEAAVYEQYRCNLLRFWYRSTEYTASGSNIGAGLVLLATNFDPDDAQFASKDEMENYWHGTSDAPFAPSGKGVLMHDVCGGYKKKNGGGLRDASLNNYYVNVSDNTAAPPSTAAKFYDMGLFQLATAGNVASTDAIGELWVEYSFTMIHPKQQPGAPAGGVAHFSSIVPTTANNLAGAVLQAGNTLSGVTLGVNTITFPAGVAGNYLINFYVGGNTSATAIVNMVPSAGASNLNLLSINGARDATSLVLSDATAAAVYVASATQTITVSSTGGLVTISPSTLVGGDQMDLWIIALPSTVLTVDEIEQKEIEVLQRENHALNDRLSRIEEMLAGGMSVVHPALKRVRAEEERKHDDEESPVYVSARGALKVRC